VRIRTRRRGLEAAQTIGQAIDTAIANGMTKLQRAAVGIAVTAAAIGFCLGVAVAVAVMLTSPEGPAGR